MLKGVIRNGRVEMAEQIDLPDGTVVVVTPDGAGDGPGPVPPYEIARVLAAIHRLEPLDIPEAVSVPIPSCGKC